MNMCYKTPASREDGAVEKHASSVATAIANNLPLAKDPQARGRTKSILYRWYGGYLAELRAPSEAWTPPTNVEEIICA